MLFGEYEESFVIYANMRAARDDVNVSPSNMENEMTKSALVLVDIQNDYFPGGLWPVHQMESAAGNARRLLEAARAKGQWVVHVQHVMPSAEAPFFKPGTDGEKINDTVAPQPDEPVVVKARPNSFAGTELEQMLRDADVSNVTLCGAMSQMCIDSTARAAADLGFAVTVAEDACGAKEVAFGDQTVEAAQVHAVMMGALAGGFANVCTTDQVLSNG